MKYLHSIPSAAGAGLARATAALGFVLIGVTAAYAQYSVTATWDRNSDGNTAGYRLFYGAASGAYQWSVDAGNQVSATLNLAAGRYYFAVVGYNTSNQYGPGSNEVSFTVGSSTPAPSAAIQASLPTPNTALVSWQTANAASASINGASVPLNGSTTVPISATTTYTITATNSAGQAATASATVVVDGGDTAPEPVVNMQANVSGTRATVSWERNPQGGAPTEYLVSVGSYPWGNDIVSNHSLGNVLSVSADMPPGSYYARVRAANAVDVARSNEPVFFRIGAELASPTNLVAEWRGTEATLRWGAVADSIAGGPANYVLEAGTAPGLADVARIPMGPATTFSASVTSGAYFVRVRAVNASGDSNPSREIVVAAPGTAAAPAALTAGGRGATVNLSWTAPAGGPQILGYVIEAGSDRYHSDLARISIGSVTEFTTTAPRGTYFIRVRAVTASGVGLPSNEIVVRVKSQK